MNPRSIFIIVVIALSAAGPHSVAAEPVTLTAAIPPLLTVMEIAAERGDTKAMTELALRYEHAEGVPRDLQKANALYCRAAKQGYAEAQFRLAWLYANGRGVPRDDGVAAELLSMAADLGFEHATRMLTYIPKRADVRLPSCLLPNAIVNPAPEARTIDGTDVASGNRSEIERLVHQIASQYAIDPVLAMAVVSVESAFNPLAVSSKNALGLMQLIPETAQRFGVKRVFDPAENIRGGLAYLRWLLAFFQGDVQLVLAAYNAGERTVEKFRGIPPYPETQEYIKKITKLYKNARHPYQPEIVAPSPILAKIKRARD